MRAELQTRIRRFFPERELYYRSRGRVRFVRLKAPAQLAILGLLFATTAWVSFSSTNLIFKNRILATKDRQIATMTAAYDDLASDLARTYERFEAVTAELESKHRELQNLFEQRAALESKVDALKRDLHEMTAARDDARAAERRLSDNLAALESELGNKIELTQSLRRDLATTSEQLRTARQERDSARRKVAAATRRVEELEIALAETQDSNKTLTRELAATSEQLRGVASDRDSARRKNLALARRVSEVEGELRAALNRADALNRDLASLATRLAKATRERDSIRGKSQSLAYRVSSLLSNLGNTSAEKSRLEKDLTEAKSRLEETAHERDSARRNGKILSDRVRQLEERLLAIREGQQALIARLQERTKSSIQSLERAIALTGLDVEQLIAAAGAVPIGQGGPLISLDGDASNANQFLGMGEAFEDSLARLETNIMRWDGLQEIFKRLPLSRPLDSGYVTSSYGKRRDPITKRRAIHYGIDYSGIRRSPILSTAPGVVAFAGRNGPYGRVVIVDHGFGFKTKYGHLAKILVKRGQKVAFRDKVGLMGSSGRSTGPHVHYEVLYKGKPQNPALFIQAGKHVFKG